MSSGSSIEAIAAPYLELLKSLHPGIESASWVGAHQSPAEVSPRQHLLPLRAHGNQPAGSVLLGLAADVNPAEVVPQIQPALNCLVGALVNVEAQLRAADLKLLRLANELDIDFQDDAGWRKRLAPSRSARVSSWRGWRHRGAS